MRIAALYDIHANLPALEAVCEALGDVDLVLVGGDASWGPWPQETMDRLRTLPRVEFIMGNTDRSIIDREEGKWKSVNDWCADRLSPEHLAFMRTWPATFTAGDMLFCHGSPRSDIDPITLETPVDRIRSWSGDVTATTIVCGHTHGQFDRHVDRWRIVNAGSVGNPFGDLGAYWAILDGGAVELRFTRYDVHTTARRMLDTGCPYAEPMAEQIQTRKTASDAARFFESRVKSASI